MVNPFSISDGKEYHIVFDTLETADDLAFSIRNQELIVETLLINADSSAVATHDHIDAKMVINSTVVNDSTVYDTIYPVVVTNVAGNVTYAYGVDYSVISENGTFLITNSDLIAEGEFAVSYRYFYLDHLQTMNGETDNPLFDGMRVVVKDKEYDLNEDSTGWTIGNCNYGLIAMNVSRFYPADFNFNLEGKVGDAIPLLVKMGL